MATFFLCAIIAVVSAALVLIGSAVLSFPRARRWALWAAVLGGVIAWFVVQL
jgi:hypothetical protein